MTRLALVLVFFLVVCPRVAAQQGPRIGPVVFDVHLTFPKFPSDSVGLAASRDNIRQTDLPGLGRGIDAGAHLYLVKWRAMTLGIGGNIMIGQSTSTPLPPPAGTPATGQAVTERLTALAPQISMNFGNGNGWSYLSGGIGQVTWSVVPAGASATAADQERIKTINYGGGARWFKKKHIGFSLDVRFYAINPGAPAGAHLAGSPRTTLFVFGAGVSVK